MATFYRNTTKRCGSPAPQEIERCGEFEVPDFLDNKARKLDANNFQEDRWWAAVKLRGWGYNDLDDKIIPNSTRIPTGFYVRKCGERERETIGLRLMPCVTVGNNHLPMEAQEGCWWRVFFVTKDCVASRLVTTEQYYLNSVDYRYAERVATGQRVFNTLKTAVQNWRQLNKKEREDQEMAMLDEEIMIRKELVRARDMDRTKFQYTTSGIAICENCDFYRGCACGGCIRCCRQVAGCTIPKSVWRESQIENQYETQPFRRKEKFTGRRMREFKKMQTEGEAQGWLIPEQFEHNININLPFLNPMIESLTSVNSEIPWKRILKDFFFMCAHLYTGKTKTTASVAVVHFITQLPIAETVISELLLRIPGWFESNAQAASIEGLFVPLLTLFGVIISTLGLGKLPNDKSITDFIMRLSKIGACVKSLEVMKEYIQPAAEAVIDYIRVNFFGYSSTNMNAWKDYEDYCDEIQKLNNSGFEERLKTEKNLVIQIDDLLMRGDVMMKTLDQLRVPPTQRSRFNAAYAWLGRMRNEAAHCSAGKHIPRVPPVIFHFVGKTGVGKSEATSLLNARLLTKLGHTDEADLFTKVYYRDCGQERFDGYNSGVVGVVVDDFGSRVDSAANPSSEPFEVIRMQNSAVWQLPMASLSEKGSTFFRAKYVIWTSNQSTFKFESITNPEAVLRRVTLKFIQYPKPEFATIKKIGKEETVTLDHFKVAEKAREQPELDIYSDVWFFDLVDAQTDADPADSETGGVKVLKREMTFDEVARMCEDALLRAQSVGQKKLDHTAAYFRKCVENQGKAQGCWDWITSGKDVAEGYDWTHVDISTMTDFRFNGQDVSPTDKDISDYNVERREEFEVFYGKTCFSVRGPTKMQERFVRGVVQATAMVEKLRLDGATPEQERELFGSVLFDFNVPIIRVRECKDPECATLIVKWFRFQQQCKKWAADQWEKVPETWKPTINAIFEAAAVILSNFCVTLMIVFGVHMSMKVAAWLFPSLDPERQRGLRLYEDVKAELKCYDEPPLELVLMKESLERKLGLTEEKQKDVTEETERRYSRLLGKVRKNGGETESFQEQTAGARRMNVESFQDRTAGARRTNVESFQERTPGSARKNVESHQDRVIGARVKNVEGNAEATNDQNAQEISHKVKRNIYGVQVISDDGSKYFVGNLLFVVGKIAITNRHIYKLIKGKEIRLFNRSCQRGTVITKEQMSSLSVSMIEEGMHAKKDVVMMEMPRHCLMHADIRPYFMTKEDFCRHSQMAAVNVLGYGTDLELQNRYSDKCQGINKLDYRLTEQDGAQSEVREWYRYGVHTRSGDCGSAVIVHDPSTNRKIIGIHMASYGSEGYFGAGVAVHQDLLKALVSGLTLKNAESGLDGVFELEGEQDDHSFGDFVNYGKTQAKAGAAKTVIRPGPVYGMLAEPKTAPAKLRPFYANGEIIDPLEMARKKADTPNVPIDEKILKQCSWHYGQKLMDLKVDDRDDKVLSWEEAIKGTEDHFYTPVKRNTSPGYGWEASGQGKQPWLGKNEEYITDHPDVIKRRDEMLQRLHAGKRASTVFQDTLKDERRPLDRVAAGKTRLFAAGEMVFCILFRQYFAGFSAHLMRNCVAAESTVGINSFGEMWSTLANTLKEVGPHVVAGDFSNYDGTLSSAVIWEVLDVIERFYENATEEERQIRRGLWCEIVNSVHATVPFEGTNHGKVGYLYQWSHSQPSGNPMTVILNSVYHSIVTRYVYKLCARKYSPEHVGLDNWDKYVRHVNYGDDDVTNIHPEIVDWFNQVTMTEAFLEIGMVYTDESKSGNLVKSRRLEEVSFLKRKFRWDGEQGRWRCPHSIDVILEMAMWVKRGANVYELTAEVLEEAVHELAQHDRSVFEAYISRFYEARKKVIRYWNCTFLTYDEYAEMDMARLGWISSSDVRAEREVETLFDC